MVLRLICLLLVGLTFSGDSDRPGGFEIVGPGGGGAMFHPSVSPHDLNTVLVSCDMTGAYISHDGGKSWRMFNLRGVVEFFVFDPRDPKVVYAQATGLWKSADNGETWNLVYPKPSAVKGIRMNSDHSDEDILADPDPLSNLFAMAIDPADSRTLYVAAGDRARNKFGAFVSRDGGGSWSKLADLPDLVNKVWVDPASAPGGRQLFLAGPRFFGLLGGAAVRKLELPPVKAVSDFSAGFADGQATFYSVGEDLAFVSEDRGASWRKVLVEGSPVQARAVATSVRNPSTAYLSYRDLEEGGLKYMGVAKTTDHGRTWKPVWKEDSN